MKVSILNEKQNALLRRKELEAAVHHENEPTPSKAVLQQLLSKQLGEAADKIDVRSIYSDRGQPRSLSRIFIWEEPPPKKEKKEAAQKEEKAEKKIKEEALKEEKKEEGEAGAGQERKEDAKMEEAKTEKAE